MTGAAKDRGSARGLGTVNLNHCYADGVLRTNEEWNTIRATFRRKHIRQDARRGKRQRHQPSALF